MNTSRPRPPEAVDGLSSKSPSGLVVSVDVPRWGRYVSDADLFDVQYARTRADLLREVLDRCAEERGDSSFLRTLRKVHLASMLADFATGSRRNGWDDVSPVTGIPSARTAPATVTVTWTDSDGISTCEQPVPLHLLDEHRSWVTEDLGGTNYHRAGVSA